MLFSGALHVIVFQNIHLKNTMLKARIAEVFITLCECFGEKKEMIFTQVKCFEFFSGTLLFLMVEEQRS